MKQAQLLTLCFLLSLTASAQKYVGGDISMLTKYEDAGVVYRDKGGNAVQPLTFFYDQGLNAMRVRLFVDPSKDSDKGVCQDLDYVKALGKRIKDTGFKFMLDFHYSDTWADPSNQWTPDAWKSLSDEELKTQIYTYTKDCLQQLKAAGATPDFIQTGNEISFGMLWGTKAAHGNDKVNRCYTNSSASYWSRFYEFLKKAGQACREECPDAKIILHSEQVPSSTVLFDYFDRMKSNSIDYDIIGLSYYPDHHRDLNTLESVIRQFETKNYGKPIMIVETGYGYKWGIGTEYDYTAVYPRTEEGQRKFTADLITMLNKHSIVTGLFWWWPEDNGNKGVIDGIWNAALYNHETGMPYAAFYELKSFVNSGDNTETDVTGQFANMDFESCTVDGGTVTECPGWTINNEQGWGTKWPVVVNEWHSGLVSGNCFQSWVGAGSTLSAGNIISQSATLPAGTYTVTAIVHTDHDGICLFANDDQQSVTATTSWGTAYEVSVTTTLTTAGTLAVGLKLPAKPTTGSEVNLYADNFKVTSQTSGITPISQPATSGKRDGWYTIDGRKLAGQPTRKGLYITGGRKVIVK